MKEIINWHHISKELPPKSGYYLVKDGRDWSPGLEALAYKSVSYSAKHRMFNASDDDTDPEKYGWRPGYVGWWAGMDDVRMVKEEY